MDSLPILTFTVTAINHEELTEIGRRMIKEPLESVDGSVRSKLRGREREVHVLVDADRLRATGLSVQQVSSALERQNVEYPAAT